VVLLSSRNVPRGMRQPPDHSTSIYSADMLSRFLDHRPRISKGDFRDSTHTAAHVIPPLAEFFGRRSSRVSFSDLSLVTAAASTVISAARFGVDNLRDLTVQARDRDYNDRGGRLRAHIHFRDGALKIEEERDGVAPLRLPTKEGLYAHRVRTGLTFWQQYIFESATLLRNWFSMNFGPDIHPKIPIEDDPDFAFDSSRTCGSHIQIASCCLVNLSNYYLMSEKIVPRYRYQRDDVIVSQAREIEILVAPGGQ
jgi:hypothetical protein